MIESPATPAPWPLLVVLYVGAFSVVVWGLAALLRGRPPRPRTEDPGPEETTLDEDGRQ